LTASSPARGKGSKGSKGRVGAKWSLWMEQMTTKEAIDRQSKNARTWWETATPQQLMNMQTARDVTTAESRKRRMESMSESEKKTALANQAKHDRAAGKKRKMLLAVRAMPGYEKATVKIVGQLRKEGKLPAID